MKTEVQPPPDKSKIPLPTLSQINADRITQVCIHSKGYIFGNCCIFVLHIFKDLAQYNKVLFA